MKIFCSDCRWIDNGYLASDTDKCGNPYNMKQFTKRSRMYMKECKDLNQNGECKYYKRKWYKIFVARTPGKIKVFKDRHPGGPIKKGKEVK